MGRRNGNSGSKRRKTQTHALPANTQAQYLRVAATTYSSSANPTAEAENLTTSSASNTNKLLSAAEIMTFGTECKDPIGVQTKSAPNAASGFDARLVMTVKDSVIGKDVANKIALHISASYTDTENPTTPVEIPEKVYAINKLFSSFLSGEDTIDAETGTGFALLTVEGIPSDVAVTFKITPVVEYKSGAKAIGATATIQFPTVVS